MKESMARIIKNKAIFDGQPVIKGTRIPVSAVLEQLKNGHGTGKHVKEMFPQLSQRDIDDTLEYAKKCFG
ncbi:MAG: DUF433 domain-containing protein [Patescibacteria group bacterium]